MEVFRSIPPSESRSPCALSIGNFDGVHLGHQAILQSLRASADQKGLSAKVLTFEPHPREYFSPQNAPARLSSLREKMEYFEEAGVQEVFICRFNQAFATISAADFASFVPWKLS